MIVLVRAVLLCTCAYIYGSVILCADVVILQSEGQSNNVDWSVLAFVCFC